MTRRVVARDTAHLYSARKKARSVKIHVSSWTWKGSKINSQLLIAATNKGLGFRLTVRPTL
jgi:hypothetical protein